MKGLCRWFGIFYGIAIASLAQQAVGASATDLCVIGESATTIVASASALQSALSQARPRTTIVVKAGSYSGDFTLSTSGVEMEPITIRAEGKVVFNDSVFTLEGAYAVLTGMIFDNGMVAVKGNYNRVTRNVFRNGAPGYNSSKLHSAVYTAGAAKYNRIDHNEVVKWQRRALRVINLKSGADGNRFDHNYLHDMTGVWGNSGEAFQVGLGPDDHPFTPRTIIEYNLVDGHELESEVLSLKSSGNVIRGNIFMNAPQGALTTRAGSHNIFINNTLKNIKRISIFADKNEVIGNRFMNSDFEARSGDCIYSEILVDNPKYPGCHPAARDTLVVGNQFSDGQIILGRKGVGSKSYDRTFPAENTMLALNEGASIEIKGQVKGVQHLSSYDGDVGDPIQLTSSQVGPAAADPLCDGATLPVAPLAPNQLRVVTTRP